MIRRVVGLLCAASLRCAAEPTEIVVKIYSEAGFSTGPDDVDGITALDVVLSHDTEENVIESLHFDGPRFRFPGEIAVIREDPSARHTLIVRATEVFGNDPQRRQISLHYRVSYTRGAITVLNVVFARVCATSVAVSPSTPAGVNCGWRGALTARDLSSLPRLGSAEATEAPCDMTCSTEFCTDVLTDPRHCGGCGRACPPAATCADGACGCLPDERRTEEGCVRFDSPHRCGTANRGCEVACRDGRCLQAGALSVGAAHACAALVEPEATGMIGAHIACWGDGASGQRGVVTRATVPSTTVFPMERAATVAAGGAHTCFLSDRGVARCWGDNRHGQLGRALEPGLDNAPTLQTPTPGEVDGGVMFERLAAGAEFTCAAAGSEAWCWGRRALGQVDGTPDPTDTRVPVRVPLPVSSGIEQIVAGESHACVRTTAGEVWCWGDNHLGQCAAGVEVTTAAPRRVEIASATDLAAGGHHTCAIAQGGVWCWGNNSSGEVGASSMAHVRTPTETPWANVGEPREIALGSAHTCVLGALGVQCWGLNEQGQLGAPTPFTNLGSLVPEAVNRLSVVALAAGGNSTCARVRTGNVLCWGAALAGVAELSVGPWEPRPVAW